MENRIEFERTLTPPDIRNRDRVLDGATYGWPSHGKFRDAFKRSNRSDDVRGLDLAGTRHAHGVAERMDCREARAEMVLCKATADRVPKRRRRNSWRRD